ncbi:hypothetical protein BAE42_10255 [Mesorhizobium loti]|nr:hypothetical protein BAE42_10255 [Mesorhizobium loti]OBQ68005.1 hypothetical protein A8146_11365 [Mesorhizobium loti]
MPDATFRLSIPSCGGPGPEKTASRYRIRDNLLGTHEFCPLVFRKDTRKIIGLELSPHAAAIIGDVPRDLLARTAAFPRSDQ